MKNKTFLLLIVALVSISSLFAQQLPVKGTIVDGKTSEPLIGVKILEKGTNNGTITNFNGEFSLSVPAGATLQISYMGYTSQVVKAGSGPINVLLQEDSKLLNEVVVVGYGTMKSKDLTSSISTVKSADLMKTQAGNALQAMQGKVAGMQVVSTGNPGDQPKIRVRGIGSYPGVGNENPLYVVDGMFFDNIDFLNPSDIASVSVLKDASASAIYGVRAANGVVLIETKSGTRGEGDHYQITYNGYYGIQHAQNILKMANAEQYSTMALESGSSADASYISNAMQRYGRSRVNPNVPDVNTDWYKEIIRDAPIQNHSFDISGGNSKATYTIGTNYFTQEGILAMKNDYERFNIRTKLDYKPNKVISIGGNLVFSNATKYNQAASAWDAAYFAVPILPVMDELNTVATPTKYANAMDIGYRGGQNPMPIMDNTNDRMLIRKLLGNVYLSLDLIPEKLIFKTAYNQSYQSLSQRNVILPYDLGHNYANTQSSVTKEYNNYFDKVWDNTLTYNEKWGQHNLSAMIGTAYRDNSWEKISAKGLGFETQFPQSWYISQSTTKPSSDLGDDGYRQYGLSYFGRLSYNYANRYILYGTIRADGSSKYQSKWGYFPALGAGWVVSEEKFWKPVKAINYLKLRFGWGQLGNENVPASDGSAVTSIVKTVFNNIETSGSQTSDTYSALKWERTDEKNFGISSKMMNNKLDLELDYYIRDTKDAVIPIGIPLVGGFFKKNAGIIRNSGLEISANWNDKISQDFSYTIGANISTLKNEVRDLYGQKYIDGGKVEFLQRTAVGQPIYSFYGYEVAGVYQNAAEIAADPIAKANNLQPGDLKFKDTDNNGVLDATDRTYLGSYLPKFMYGANLGFTYKNLDFSANFMGQTGNKILNRKRGEILWTNDLNMDADLAINRWHGEGTSNKYPSSSGLRRGWNQKMSTYFVEDGSFFRIQNIQMGYTVKKIAFGSIKLPEARITLTAERPLTVFSYHGFNPEVENGIDSQTYPIPAVYTVGLNLKF